MRESRSRVLLGQAFVTMDVVGGGREIRGTVQRDQVPTVEKGKRLQNLAPLQTAEDIAEAGAKDGRIDVIEDRPHLGIAGDVFDPEDRAEVVAEVVAALVEREQGRILESEHGECGHEGIAHGDRGVHTPVGDFVECGAEECIEGIGRQIRAAQTRGLSRRVIIGIAGFSLARKRWMR
jgi:hypothetical protein